MRPMLCGLSDAAFARYVRQPARDELEAVAIGAFIPALAGSVSEMVELRSASECRRPRSLVGFVEPYSPCSSGRLIARGSARAAAGGVWSCAVSYDYDLFRGAQVMRLYSPVLGSRRASASVIHASAQTTLQSRGPGDVCLPDRAEDHDQRSGRRHRHAGVTQTQR